MAGIVDKFQKMWNPPDDEVDYVYDEEGRKKLKPQIAGKKFLPVVAARETTKWSISTLPPSCRWCCLSPKTSARKPALWLTSF